MDAMVPDRAGIGERNGGALEIGGASVCRSGRGLTRSSKAAMYWAKSSAPAFLMLGTIRLRRAVFARDVDGDAEVDFLCWTTRQGSPLFSVKAWLRAGIGLDGFHDRPADDVRVGDLALAEQCRDGD